jgi:hypothetical protein
MIPFCRDATKRGIVLMYWKIAICCGTVTFTCLSKIVNISEYSEYLVNT